MKKKIFTKRAVSLLSLLSLIPSISLAQTADPASIFDMSLAEIVETKTVTAATQNPVGVKDAPATVFVFSKDEIRKRGYRNLEKLLADVPGIEIQKNSGFGLNNTISVRGVQGNAKLMILMDGYRINSPTGTPNMIGEQFSLKDAKRVEVILGPASALYGADAFSGIVNIVTLNGSDIDGIVADVSGGDFGTKEGSVSFGKKLGNVETTLTAHTYKSDEPFYPKYYAYDYKWYTDQYSQNGNMLSFPFDPQVVKTSPIEPWSTKTQTSYLHGKFNIENLEAGVAILQEEHSSTAGSRPEFGIYSKDAEIASRNISAYLKHLYTSPDKAVLLRTSMWRGSFELLPKAAFVDLFTGYKPGYKHANESSTRLEEQATLNISSNTTVVGGAMYEVLNSEPWSGDLPFRYDSSKSPPEQNIYYPGTNIVDANGKDMRIYQDFHQITYKNASIYGQLQQKLLDEKLQITAGTRADHSDHWGNTVNPRLGVVYRPSDALRLKFLYGRAFLAPSPYYSYTHYGSFIPHNQPDGTIKFSAPYWYLPNSNLKPERLTSIEGTIDYFVTKDVVASLNLFRNDSRKVITSGRADNVVFKGIPVDYAEIPQNRSKMNSYGAMLGVDALLLSKENGLSAKTYAYYTYLDGKLDDKQLGYFANHSLKAGAEITWGNYSLSPILSARSRTYSMLFQRTGDRKYSSSPFTTLNLYGEYKGLYESSSFSSVLFVDVTNLTDRRYYNVSLETEEYLPAVPQLPRRVLAGVRVRF